MPTPISQMTDEQLINHYHWMVHHDYDVDAEIEEMDKRHIHTWQYHQEYGSNRWVSNGVRPSTPQG